MRVGSNSENTQICNIIIKIIQELLGLEGWRVMVSEQERTMIDHNPTIREPDLTLTTWREDFALHREWTSSPLTLLSPSITWTVSNIGNICTKVHIMFYS